MEKNLIQKYSSFSMISINKIKKIKANQYGKNCMRKDLSFSTISYKQLFDIQKQIIMKKI